MGISEFALHNVLRTYARQDRLGKVQKGRTHAAKSPSTPVDQVSLSNAGRKVQVIGQLAAEVVDRRHPDLSTEARSTLVRDTQQELLERHQNAVANDRVSAETFADQLRPRYAL